jgi:hypothetical protein
MDEYQVKELEDLERNLQELQDEEESIKDRIYEIKLGTFMEIYRDIQGCLKDITGYNDKKVLDDEIILFGSIRDELKLFVKNYRGVRGG